MNELPAKSEMGKNVTDKQWVNRPDEPGFVAALASAGMIRTKKKKKKA